MNRFHLLGLFLLVTPALAHAQDEDRYGPAAAPEPPPAASPAAASTAASPPRATYHGAFLQWANKPQGALAQPAAEQRPTPVAAPAPTPVAATNDAPRPTSLYDRPQPSPTNLPARSTAVPPPTVATVAPAPTPAAPVAVAASSTPPAPGTPVRARFYSLHRAYGDRPDAIAAPTERPPVLIGPSDSRVADDEETGPEKTSDAPF